MRPGKDGEWEYVEEKSTRPANTDGDRGEKLNDLWRDTDKEELDKLELAPEMTVLLVNGDTTTIRRPANNKTEENLELRV